jgi:hypothetical protein
MPGVQASDVKRSPPQLMHKPWRHRARFEPNASIVPGVPPHHLLNLFGVGGALATPYPSTCIVNDADRRHPLRNIQADK